MLEMYIKKIKYFAVLILIIAVTVSCSKNGTAEKNAGKNTINEKTVNTGTEVKTADSTKIPAGLLKLIKAYPEFLERADANNLYWKDGSSMVYDDGREKSHDEMLENPDLEDMMSQPYTMGAGWDKPPDVNFEPGRIRYEPFFAKMYGSSESGVRKNLTTVTWMPGISGTPLMVNTVNEVDVQLRAVCDDLAKLDNEFMKYVKRTAGTFNYRVIAGTQRLSAHSYGIAIDINTEYSDYWQWDKSMKYKNKIPMEVVEVFENRGFIWGGKWYHYDTMHFEYRPELLVK